MEMSCPQLLVSIKWIYSFELGRTTTTKALHTNTNRSSLGVSGLWTAFLLLLLYSTYTL